MQYGYSLPRCAITSINIARVIETRIGACLSVHDYHGGPRVYMHLFCWFNVADAHRDDGKRFVVHANEKADGVY
jgi:hypothetical protein